MALKVLFVSTPMKGIEDVELIKLRLHECLEEVRTLFPDDDVRLLNTVITDDIPDFLKADLYCLGTNIRRMSAADIVYFDNGWENARGCKIEHECAKEYGIETILYYDKE